MDEANVQIGFTGTTSAQADQLAGDLETFLSQVDQSVKVTRSRPDPQAMSLGTELVLVLGTPAVAALAEALAAWITRKGTRVRISCNGDVLGENLTSADMVKLAQAVAKRR